MNNTVVKTFSKRQTTVESSTYGSELVAARLATDSVVELIYTLQMIGVPIDGSALMLGDNKSVVINTTIPSSALKKKHNAKFQVGQSKVGFQVVEAPLSSIAKSLFLSERLLKLFSLRQSSVKLKRSRL